MTPALEDEAPDVFAEEMANAAIQGIGAVLSVVGLVVLIHLAIPYGPLPVASVAVYGGTLVLAFFSSALYHAIWHVGIKRILRAVDHCAIYFLIAGTYTPFTLGVLRGDWGWTLFGLVWALAVVGTVFKALGGVRYTTFSTWVYLAMGWLVLIAIEPVLTLVPKWGLFWLLAGGIAYTAGAVFFMAERVRYFHFVWHLFVVMGTACHFVAVLRYAT